jgi:L-lactate dehydrogenase complex protein LldG
VLDRAARIDLFVDRLLDYDARVHSVASEELIAGAVEQVLAASGETRLIASASLDSAWLPAGVDVTIDEASTTDVVDRAQAVVTTCEVAIASTGTIILVHTGAQGRRVLTLLPDHHMCIVRRDQVCELVPEALARLSAHDGLPITTISGPSATSDIEMTRIRGVHGPRRLTVILCG